MKNMYIRLIRIHILIGFLIVDSCYSNLRVITNSELGYPQPSVVPIGLVLDVDSPLGSMLNLCIQIALSDTYLKYPNFTTVLQLHTRNAQSVLDANLAVEDLLEHEQVRAIIGPQGFTQDVYLSELGQRFNVPTISITARTSPPSTAAAQNNFSLRATMDDVVQARAIAALCQEFQWPQAVLLYEDTYYGYRFQSHLTNSFRGVGIGLVHLTAIPLSADRKLLTKLLTPLKDQETRVFLVHANHFLGFRLFEVAKNAGMMREGSVWIVTDSMSNYLSSMDSGTRESMEGVLAMRPYVPPSKELRYFQERFERNSSRASMDLNIHGVWGYDTITALAVAVENIGPVTPNSSSYGSRLLRELSNTRFRGLSGNFELVKGTLKPSDFEIANLIGTGERRVGMWNPHRGFTRELSSKIWDLKTTLKNVVWPGDSMVTPKGWDIPTSGTLRVGVPWKPGFKEFVNVSIDLATNETRASGFAVDIFLYALKQIPFHINYTFLIYNESTGSNWSYDSMLHEIPEKYDMVVADTTIWAPRASYVDFSLPYSESGIVFVVKNQKPLNIWIFTKPLSWGLWGAIIIASLVMGSILWMLEAPARARAPAPVPVPAPVPAKEPNIRGEDERLRVGILVAVAALAFPETALVGRRTSLFLLAVWLFCAFILMQSYTASLSAILTLSHLKFSFSDDHYIGYHNGSFTREFLVDRLHISPTKLRPYVSAQQYHDAMCRGSKNGGIDAIFDELPYMKLFLHRYENRYATAGPTYRTDGLGFAFGVGSPLVAYFSRAMLNVTQGSDMTALEQKNFGPGYSSQDPLQNVLSQGASGLTFHDFGGLFIILVVLTLFAFVWAKIVDYRNRDRAPAGNDPEDNDPADGERNGANVGADDDAGGGDGNINEGNREGENAGIEMGELEQNNEGPERVRDGNDHHQLP